MDFNLISNFNLIFQTRFQVQSIWRWRSQWKDTPPSVTHSSRLHHDFISISCNLGFCLKTFILCPNQLKTWVQPQIRSKIQNTSNQSCLLIHGCIYWLYNVKWDLVKQTKIFILCTLKRVSSHHQFLIALILRSRATNLLSFCSWMSIL